MGSGKPRGLNAARKLRTTRVKNRWANKYYKKHNLGTQYKCNPFGGSSHCKGIVLEKMCAHAPAQPAALDAHRTATEGRGCRRGLLPGAAARLACSVAHAHLPSPLGRFSQWHRGEAAELCHPQVRARPAHQKRQEDRRLRAA